MAKRKKGSITKIMKKDARLVPALPFKRKKTGSPKMRAAVKQRICLFVRLKATFVFNLCQILRYGYIRHKNLLSIKA